MEQNITPSPQPIAAPIVEAPIVEAPIAAPIPQVVEVSSEAKPIMQEGGEVDKKFFGVKLEFVVLGVLSFITASYVMSILHYRKAIQTNNTIVYLQDQLDNLKKQVATINKKPT